ncbi:hypothetical protein P692DRAFT_20880123 [Suillus brevipes Sb2]|nr:hypothetical protein P692DRAFT_20880123 [Suillus brevipes Sb2]
MTRHKEVGHIELDAGRRSMDGSYTQSQFHLSSHPMPERPTAEIAVPSKDPKEKKKEEDKKLDTKANGVKDEDEELCVPTEPWGTLRYRLLSALPPTSKIFEPSFWGYEYILHLAAELGEEYTIHQEGEKAVPLPVPEADSDAPKSMPAPVPGTIEDLHNLGLECATFFLGPKVEGTMCYLRR